MQTFDYNTKILKISQTDKLFVEWGKASDETSK
jgi:hypothetical protein